ncbi:MAG: AgmX/PglI C-terminal domain-containing protein [Deltaproteobacteria bacterium]
MSALALHFKIFRGDRLVREETLRQTVIKIGKVSSAHLRIDDESVSRMHAILEVDTHGDVHVIDLGSTRGTFINGHKVNKAKLESGDAIQVGELRIEVAFARTDAVIAAPTMIVAPPPTSVPPPVPVAKPATYAPPRAVTAAAPVPCATAPQEDDLSGAKAIEVAALLGDSVVCVKHCIDPKSGKVSSKTWGLFAAGISCLVIAAIAFGVSVHTAAYNKGGLDYTTHVLHKPAYSFRPEVLSPAFDWLAFGGLALGLSALIAGLARRRAEKRTPYYRIGTAAGVELALDSAPSPSFPLVAPSADGEDFVFNYSTGIDGELVLDGRTTSLADLAASGRARPSMVTAGALELPIPARARIRARSGQTTFVVSAVPQPRQQPVSLLGAMESRTMKYFAGSLVVHLCLLAVLQQLPGDDSSAAIDLGDMTDVSIRSTTTATETTPPEQVAATDGEKSGSDPGAEANKMRLERGEMGNPESSAADHHFTIKDNHMDPQIARQQAIEEARDAGILGGLHASPEMFRNLTASSEFSSDFENMNAYGAMFGAEAGESHGSFGGSFSGFGGGGGCTQEPCGLIGTGSRYNTINVGAHAGHGYGPGGGGTGPFRRHEAGVPRPILGQATGTGDLDQATIRRYMNRNIEKIRYCYEHELLAHPGIEGTVTVQFFINPTGGVTGSKGAGFDATVAGCVGDVVGNIAFPRPNGGGVQVNYPFIFHATSH